MLNNTVHPNIHNMSVTSYGGIDDPETGKNLTGSFHVITFINTKKVTYRVCVDIGAHQGSGDDYNLNSQVEVIPDAVVITHAHMDHIGRLPVLWKHPEFRGKKGKIYMGHLTKLVGTEALLDAANILMKKYIALEEVHEKTYKALKEALKEEKEIQKDNPTNDRSKQTRERKNQDKRRGNNMRITDTSPRKRKGQVYVIQESKELKITPEKAKTILSPYNGSVEAWSKDNKPLPPVFNKEDVLEMMEGVKTEKETIEGVISLPDGMFTEILPGISVRPYNAGHVLGSKSILFSVQKGSKKNEYAYFSGDIGSYKWPTKPAGRIEVPSDEFPLIFATTESTYGGTVRGDFEHGMSNLEKDLKKAVTEKLASVFACFSLDRAQRILHELLILQKKNGWTFPIYLDSPLAMTYTALYSVYAEDAEFRNNMKRVDVITSKEMRDTVLKDKNEKFRVIITCSGMAEAGFIRTYLFKWLKNSRVEFSFPGYMATGTDGWRLTAAKKPEYLDFKIDTEKKGGKKNEENQSSSMKEDKVSLSTVKLRVEAKINHYTHFSGHADEDDILDWYMNLPKAPRMKLSIVHGVQKDSSRLLSDKLKRHGVKKEYIIIPRLKQEIVVF